MTLELITIKQRGNNSGTAKHNKKRYFLRRHLAGVRSCEILDPLKKGCVMKWNVVRKVRIFGEGGLLAHNILFFLKGGPPISEQN